MNPAVEPIARAVLYEGYVLYPYRPGALKNRHRWSPGGLVPRSYSEAHGGTDPYFLQAECLVEGSGVAVLSGRVGFLHALSRSGGDVSWQEATERAVPLPELRLDALADSPHRLALHFPASLEVAGDGEWTQNVIEGEVELAAARLGEQLFRVTVRVANRTPLEATSREEAALRTLASAHVVLCVRGGEFVSLLDPPAELRPQAEACRNVGVWPVLVGEPGRRDTVLAPPIILDDYPRVAPESPGDFFDGTEIDEMLALRVLTLTDDEKRELRRGDGLARAVLERVEALSPNRLAGLHGAVRGVRSVGVRPGDRVRLRPRGRADAFDLLLAGKVATVAGVETDFEGTAYVMVTVDGDPGADLGAAGRPGHRFFYRADEVEPIGEGAP
jgi:hypothetical protein